MTELVWDKDYIDQIICGDCLEVMKGIPDKSVDLVVTDPPYFLPVNTYVQTRGQGQYRRTLGDMSILKGYFERIFIELSRVIKETGTYYVFCDAQSYPIFYQVMYPLCKYVRLLIWDKKISYNGYTWRHQHELIAWGELQKTKRIPTGDGDILKCRGVLQKNRSHPAEKPISLFLELIKKHIENEKLLVLDNYIGCGNTAIACRKLGQKFIGIDIEKKYCGIARKRVSEAKYTPTLF